MTTAQAQRTAQKGVQPRTGCTECRSENTATLDLFHGRRCAEHPPAFVPEHAVRLAVAGELAQALTYCRTEVPC